MKRAVSFYNHPSPGSLRFFLTDRLLFYYIPHVPSVSNASLCPKAVLASALAEKGVYPLAGPGQAGQAGLSVQEEVKVPTLPVRSTPRGKILIVDDDPAVRQQMGQNLSLRGYQTECASDGFEAGVQVMEFRPHLVLLRLLMPGMNGFEVYRKIKENPKTAATLVLIISDYDNKRERLLHKVEGLMETRATAGAAGGESG